MRVRTLVATGSLLVTAAAGVSACGDAGTGGGAGGTVPGTTLTIYSSLPFDPARRQQSQDMVNGEKLALERVGSKVGKLKIKYVSLDDANASGWEASKVANNARRAAKDKTTIAYLGEFHSAASRISMPILNRSGILQISPTNAYLGLTKKSARPTEPEEYRPTGNRTYGRVIPADNIQAVAQATYMKQNGVKKLFILHDRETYGKSIADEVGKAAKAQGIQVAANEGIDPRAPDYRALAAKIEGSGADALFFGGITANNAVKLWDDVSVANPKLKMFGPDSLTDPPFTETLGKAEKQTYLTTPTLPQNLYPPAAKEFFSEFESKYKAEPDPYAIYGYEAMSVLLEALKQAGEKANERQAVVDELFKIKNRESVLGTYSIDPDGDTTLSNYGGNRVEKGKLVFDKVIKVPAE